MTPSQKLPKNVGDLGKLIVAQSQINRPIKSHWVGPRLLRSMLVNEETREYSLRKGKYHCMADLLFDQSGFGQTSKSVYSFNSTKELNPNQSNRRSAIQ